MYTIQVGGGGRVGFNLVFIVACAVILRPSSSAPPPPVPSSARDVIRKPQLPKHPKMYFSFLF